MANEVLVKPGTAITFKDSGGTAVITLNNLGFGAGRVSAQYDKGSGAQEAWFHVHAVIQFETACIAGEVVEVYIVNHDGTNVPGSLGVVDAAVSVANKRNNLHCPLIVISAEAVTADLNYEATGIAYCPMRYISVMVWNASAGDNLQATNNINIITLTPLVDEIQ